MGREKQCRIKIAGRQNVNVDYLKHTLILSNYRGVPQIVTYVADRTSNG